MKKIFYLIILILFWANSEAQQVTPAIKAGFGVEGELRANYFNNFPQSGNDDWFNMSAGAGAFVIDTTGAAGIVSRYATDPAFRQLPFFRTMKYPAYSIVNNKLLLDAIFIRDYHGTDSTIFASGASKNGESPADWTCPVAQSVPDKNEILDMMVHVRRAGPSATDSLWMFGGLSIENTTGDRYFDFEMYQSDIYYDRGTQKFYGYGPDAGHTSWKFDAAGDITQPGDIIFSADFGGSGLSALQARIWVDKASLSLNPVNFDWAGTFDGASNGSQFGYAGILPKTAGNFYLGSQSPNNTWAGPFALVRGDNSVATTYTTDQFMEIGVNLSKIGLDPVSLLGANICGMPFRRILVKSRASAAFTSALKDFVGPFDFFLPARAKIESDQSVLCGLIGVSQISVTDPVSTSIYTWSTTDGHIVSTSPDGTSITVDSAGTYVVNQQLQGGCSTYASDTTVIFYNSSCFVLENKLLNFSGNVSNSEVQLKWTVSQNSQISRFNIERSTDGIHFFTVGEVFADPGETLIHEYSTIDIPDEINSGYVYYRLKLFSDAGSVSYSKTIGLFLRQTGKSVISIAPNPVKEKFQLNISSLSANKLRLFIYDNSGRLMRKLFTNVPAGNSSISLSDFQGWQRGVYSLKVLLGESLFVEKMVLVK